ncbi:MAG: hypothetical protein HYU34_01695 [Candidatus Omnitrophica bacterium]|nr:hypothetical protein [Candidatus Omnitrophota bacterium]
MSKEKIVHFLALFGSTSTLLCCALPALLATVAGGVVLSALISAFPWLIPLSRNKDWIFIIAGVLILISGILTFGPKGKIACALTGGKGCEVAGGFTRILFFVSLAIYLMGGFVAYALVPLLRFFEA